MVFLGENALNKDVLVVDFEGNEITFTKQDMMELTHAYCTSIHKSQGSEFPIVIMPIVKQYFRMLQRPILYTGLTRAKTSLVLLGDPEAFDIGLKTNGQARLTQLCTLLKIILIQKMKKCWKTQQLMIQELHKRQ